MSREEVLLLVKNIFVDTFEVEASSITEETSSTEIKNWDSLNHVVLIAAVEEKFKVKFPLGELMELKSIGEIVNSVMEKMV